MSKREVHHSQALQLMHSLRLSIVAACRLWISFASDFLAAADKGLILLDLSAAFDTVDHNILLQRLHHTFGIDSAVIQWFQSYLSGRMQYIRRGLKRPDLYKMLCGVSQGSVHGPILFILYTGADFVYFFTYMLTTRKYSDRVAQLTLMK
jgi:hypothetical protein